MDMSIIIISFESNSFLGDDCYCLISVCWDPAHWGLRKIDGLLVPPDKASNLLTDHLTNWPLMDNPAQEKWFSQTVHT